MCPMPVLDIDCEGLISIFRSTVRITTTSRSTGSVSDFGTELEPGMETDTKLQIFTLHCHMCTLGLSINRYSEVLCIRVLMLAVPGFARAHGYSNEDQRNKNRK